MKVLITGCAGFVGSNLFNTYKSSQDVWGCDNLQFGYPENVEYNNWSRCGFETLSTGFINQYDVLVHLATANIIYCQNEPVDTFNTNAVKTFDLFKRFKGKIIYTSTASVYGDSLNIPTREKDKISLTNAYSMSKYMAEQYLEARGNYTTLRLSNVYGPNQRPEHPYSGVIGKFLGSDELYIFGDGSQSRDYTYVTDVVYAIQKAIELPALNTVINIASGVETRVNDLIKFFDKKVNYIEPRSIDTVNRRCLDISKSKELLGWEPLISLDLGINSLKHWPVM